LAASKEELDRLYKENANLMRRLADARTDGPVMFKSTEPPAVAATTPKEYEVGLKRAAITLRWSYRSGQSPLTA